MGVMRILLIEDEKHLAAAIRRGLEADGHAVDVAHDGVDGLWRADEGRFDAVILDILLPGMNGYKVCSTLRSRGNSVPILMLTAKDGEYDEAEGLDTGADDYLTKPFSFVVLEARLRAIVRRSAGEVDNVLHVGDLELDTVRRVCTRAGVEIALTPREQQLLEHLMRHKGEVLSKYEIVDAVWGMGFDGDPNIVEVYIGYLRKKIDVPFTGKLIHTVRGHGYRMEAA